MISKFKTLGWLGLFFLNLLAVYLFIYVRTGDWYQGFIAAIFGFPAHLIFFVFGSGCIIKGFFQIAERPILKAAIAGNRLKDGHRVAIFGTIESTSGPTHTPFSQKACVGYKYFIKHRKYISGSDSDSSFVYPIIAAGWGLAPAIIVSKNGSFRIGGFPLIEEFSEEEKEYDDRSSRIILKNGIMRQRDNLVSKEFPDEEYDDASRQHLESITSSIDFEMAGFKKWFIRNIEQFTPDTILFGDSLFKRIDDDEVYHKDIKFFKTLKSDYNNRRPDKTTETLISIGAEVCIFGTYLANEKAIVPGRWRSMRLINGNRSKVLESMRMNYWAYFVVGLILISIEIGGILYLTS
ncbi:MAG: YpbF family protein [Deltaproteobacteria bacterium]|nr:YpbF family protein [Deltaproteobacteria bacterium]